MVILVAACLVFAAVFLFQESRKRYVPAVVLKGLASVCFVILGILCSPGTLLAKRIICGLVLGCIADVLLNLRYVVREKGQLVFLIGILVFLSGHILYLTAVAGLSGKWLICAVIGVILTALLMVWIFRRIEAKPAFKIFGVFYIGAIMILDCIAAGNLIAAPSAFTGLFAAGAVLSS